MWRIPDICVFGLFCAVIVFFGMWLMYRWRLRQATRAMHVRFNKELAQRTRIAREFYDTMLQTVQGCKFVADDAFEKADDITYMRYAIEKLSSWLGQATQEGQEALNSLPASTTEENDD